MMLVYKFEPKKKKKMKMIKLQHKNIKKKKKKSILHIKNFIFIAQIRITSSNALLMSIFTEEIPT
jgi:accessory gene regulator protein AgrB